MKKILIVFSIALLSCGWFGKSTADKKRIEAEEAAKFHTDFASISRELYERDKSILETIIKSNESILDRITRKARQDKAQNIKRSEYYTFMQDTALEFLEKQTQSYREQLLELKKIKHPKFDAVEIGMFPFQQDSIHY